LFIKRVRNIFNVQIISFIIIPIFVTWATYLSIIVLLLSRPRPAFAIRVSLRSCYTFAICICGFSFGSFLRITFTFGIGATPTPFAAIRSYTSTIRPAPTFALTIAIFWSGIFLWILFLISWLFSIFTFTFTLTL